MDQRSQAEEHLRAIRNLMERAVFYRSLSSPSALVSAALSFLAALPLVLLRPPRLTPLLFVGLWSGVFLVASLFNIWSLQQGAHRRNENFISPGLKAAVRSLLPPLLAGAVTTFALVFTGSYRFVALWMIFYGLALIATQHFAPASLFYLGLAFLLSGLTFLPLICYWIPDNSHTAAVAMAVTFGGLHLIYALLTWPTHDVAFRQTR
jgi:hypothetical protein